MAKIKNKVCHYHEQSYLCVIKNGEFQPINGKLCSYILVTFTCYTSDSGF